MRFIFINQRDACSKQNCTRVLILLILFSFRFSFNLTCRQPFSRARADTVILLGDTGVAKGGGGRGPRPPVFQTKHKHTLSLIHI